MINFLKRLVLFAALTTLFTLNGCKKHQDVQKVETTANIQDYDKMLQFLSITLGVEKSRIKFDESKKLFYMPNPVYSESLESVQERYGNANEYKLNYEQSN